MQFNWIKLETANIRKLFYINIQIYNTSVCYFNRLKCPKYLENWYLEHTRQ